MESFVSFLLKLRNRHFLALDFLIFLATPAIALLLRVDDSEVVGNNLGALAVATLLFLAVKLSVFYRGNMYSRFWRYASVEELAHIAFLGLLALILQTLLYLLVLRPLGWVHGLPQSLPLIEALVALPATAGLRFSVPLAARVLHRRTGKRETQRVLVVGAGSAGVMIVQEMQRNLPLGLKPVAFVDDDPEKQGVRIRGVPVLGHCRDIARVCEEITAHQVVIAMPTAPGKVIREIVGICEEAGVQTKIIPGIHELLDGTASVKQLRDVDIHDLLRREPIQTDTAAVRELIRGRCVLITGAGGSIGSELCRQVLRFAPRTMILVGHGENSIFEIHNELLRIRDRGPAGASAPSANGHKATTIIPLIADIRFADRIQALFAEYRPEIVFHAAAHKHVPLMEVNPTEAITNNVLGTRNLLQAAQATDVNHFVMISTDKAVNPTSVMGASKRAAELLVHQASHESGRPYVAVRFGNVLGSRGSVVLTFKQQIAAGGPVTVTHPDMVRYFMTIPEAVQLVLQAAVLGQGGEVFTLDMGEPVKIVDLARDLIELSGLEVGRDIDITFQGMRPGEKLFEELFIPGEHYARTAHPKIFVAANASSFVPANLDRSLAGLGAAAARHENPAVVQGLQDLIPEFAPAGTAVEGTGRRGEPLQVVPLPSRAPAGRIANGTAWASASANGAGDHKPGIAIAGSEPIWPHSSHS